MGASTASFNQGLPVTTKTLKLALVTGTGGLGLAIAKGLVAGGVEVILAGRNPDAGETAVAEMRAASPGAVVSFAQIDLADIPAVAEAARRIGTERDRLDILVNSAGLVSMQRTTTPSGAETMFGVNHLGHFALTGHLLPLLRNSADARVVSIVGTAYRGATMNFDDLNSEQSFNAMKAGGQSMLAKVLFVTELQRRSDAHGWNLKSVAADPGFARTGLIRNAPGPMKLFVGIMGSLLGQSAADGAGPALVGAIGDAAPGGYYAPSSGLRGPAIRKDIAPVGLDPVAGQRLWEASQEMTGFPFPA